MISKKSPFLGTKCRLAPIFSAVSQKETFLETTAKYITQNRTPICLGIDPGIGNTGWGVVQRLPSGYQLVGFGVIHTPANAPIGERLNTCYATIRELITEHGPHLVSIKNVFFNRNISSCISTASVMGDCGAGKHTGGSPNATNQTAGSQIRSHR